MQPQDTMSQVIEGKRYSVKGATLLAGDDYWDGHNFERHGTNSFLYRGKGGSYFAVHLTQWEGSRDSDSFLAIEPLTDEEAKHRYEALPEHSVEFEVAFPGSVVPDA